MSKAINTTLYGTKPDFESLLFAPMLRHTDKPFPYDVTFLDEKSLQHIQSFGQENDYEIWSRERLTAARSRDILARRAAVSAFLWERYISDPHITLDKLKLWHEIEEIEKSLTPPSWFVNQYSGEDVKTAWDNRLGKQKEFLQARHGEVIKQLMTG